MAREEKVEIKLVKAHVLDPKKQYMIVVPLNTLDPSDAYHLSQEIYKMGVKVVVVIESGDKHIRVEELPSG